MINLNQKLRVVRLPDGRLGWFHTFSTRTTDNGKHEPVAIIEHESGGVSVILAAWVTFLEPHGKPGESK